MLEALFGSINRERILIFIHSRNQGNAKEISLFFDTDFNSIQKQLEKLETSSVLKCKDTEETKLYRFNPKYPFLAEMRILLEKALSHYPKKERERLITFKQRPKRKGKPVEIYLSDET